MIKSSETMNKVRTDKRFSAILVTCFASLIGAVTVTSGSAAQAQTQTENMTSANNMTSASLAVVTNGLQQDAKVAQDTANALASVSSSQPEANNPFDPFTNGDNR